MTQELSRHERAVVAEFGIHPEDTTPAAEARRHGWSAGTRLHGGPVRFKGREVEQPVDVVITAVGLEQVLAIPASGDRAEHTIRFDAREWTETGDCYRAHIEYQNGTTSDD